MPNVDLHIGQLKKWFAQQHKQPKAAHRGPRFSETKPNRLHQSGLMFLPNENGYKYLLCVVDAASRYKAAYPLHTKNSEEVVDGLNHIYTTTKLTPPAFFACDAGSEFNGKVTTARTRIRRAEKGRHRSQTFVESFNKQLAKRIFAPPGARRTTDRPRQ